MRLLSEYDIKLTSCCDCEHEVVGQDVYGKELYYDTDVYDTEIGLVHENDMVRFFEDRNELTSEHTGTFKFYDGSYEDIEEIADVILYDGYWFTSGEVYDFLEFYEWSPVTYNDL